MHIINVLTYGPENFNTSLEELKEFFRFKLSLTSKEIDQFSIKDYDVLLVHEDYLKENSLNKIKKIKILLTHSETILPANFHGKLTLPTSVNNLNEIVENSVAKKNYNKNSSIEIKKYILNKNEKKLQKKNKFILLTEKEIHLLELLLDNKTSLPKEEILKRVWKYSEDADTHTVETHIYRLRKKIKDNFLDDHFILNDKDGYLL